VTTKPSIPVVIDASGEIPFFIAALLDLTSGSFSKSNEPEVEAILQTVWVTRMSDPLRALVHEWLRDYQTDADEKEAAATAMLLLDLWAPPIPVTT
jgi:hypothetical protein